MKEGKEHLETFGSRVLHYLFELQIPHNLPQGVSVINPYENAVASVLLEKFYKRYFSDNHKRIFIFGVNLGRFGSGVTGIPFTDPVELEESCGINNDLKKQRELSSQFVYKVVQQLGGPKVFYEKYFLTALSPMGFLKEGKNYNYYDDHEILESTESYIRESVRKQMALGARTDIVIILGLGKNLHYFTKLNDKYNFFESVHAIEHPRYIMQYKRKELEAYIQKYMSILSV